MKDNHMHPERIEQILENLVSGRKPAKRGDVPRAITAAMAHLGGGPDRARWRIERRERMRAKKADRLLAEYQAELPSKLRTIERDSTGGLKRGPLPDLNRELSERSMTVWLTKRETKALLQHKARLAEDSTPSTFLRLVLCQWLEAHRDRTRERRPFCLDIASLDYRTKQQGSRLVPSAARREP